MGFVVGLMCLCLSLLCTEDHNTWISMQCIINDKTQWTLLLRKQLPGCSLQVKQSVYSPRAHGAFWETGQEYKNITCPVCTHCHTAGRFHREGLQTLTTQQTLLIQSQPPHKRHVTPATQICMIFLQEFQSGTHIPPRLFVMNWKTHWTPDWNMFNRFCSGWGRDAASINFIG